MREVHIDVLKGLRQGILFPMLPGALPAILMALYGYYINAYFIELLIFSTVYAALFMKKIWGLRSFWIGIIISIIGDILFVSTISSKGHHSPFFIFTPFVILYCVALIYGLRWLAFRIDGVKVIFDQ
jgi:hypothetical protein